MRKLFLNKKAIKIRQISAAILTLFCGPAIGRSIPRRSTLMIPSNQTISNLTISNQDVYVLGKANHITLSNFANVLVYDGGQISNSKVGGYHAFLSIFPKSNADHLSIEDHSIVYIDGGSINFPKITEDGMLGVFKNSQVHNAILNGSPEKTRWSMRLYEGGNADNTIIKHGLMIIEKGHAKNTVVSNAPSPHHLFNLKAYGGYLTNTVLKNGGKLLVQASKQEGSTLLNKLNIYQGSEADINGIDTLRATGNQITVHNGGRLELGPYVDIQNTKIQRGAELGLANNDTLSGTTLLSGRIHTGPSFRHLANNGQLAIQEANRYTITFPITGSGSLIQQGQGDVILKGSNLYTGNTIVGSKLRSKLLSRLEVDGSISGPTKILRNGVLAGNGTLASVQNAGILAPGQLGKNNATGKLTIRGNYTGLPNSQLRINAILGDSHSPTDQLTIDGGRVYGKTRVIVINHGGLGAQTTGNGIEIIHAIHHANTGAQNKNHAFYLKAPVKAGAYDYLLFGGDQTGKGQNWYLRSTLRDRTPLYRPSAAMLSSALNIFHSMILTSMGTKIKRDGNLLANNKGIWARILAIKNQEQASGTVSPMYKGYITGVQIGTNFIHRPYFSGEQTLGAYITNLKADEKGYGFADGSFHKFVGHLHPRTVNLGLYWETHLPSGWYSNAVFQTSRIKGNIQSVDGDQSDLNGHGYAISYEAGRSFSLNSSLKLTPQTQLIHNQLDLKDIDLPFSHVHFQDQHQWLTRLGLMLQWTHSPLHPYVIGNWWHQSKQKSQLSFDYQGHKETFDSQLGNNRIEIGVGVSGHLNQHTRLYSRLDYTQDPKQHQNKQYQINIGIQYKF